MSDEANDLEARKNELFATITLLAGVKRDLIGARGQRRLTLIERQAQLEADKERLSHEVNSEYMYRNLQAFMNRVDEYDAQRQKEAKETHSGLAALSGQFRELAADVTQLKKDMVDSQADRQRLHTQDTAILQEVAGVKDDVAAIDAKFVVLQERLEAYIAGSKRHEVGDLRREIDLLKQARGDGD